MQEVHLPRNLYPFKNLYCKEILSDMVRVFFVRSYRGREKVCAGIMKFDFIKMRLKF